MITQTSLSSVIHCPIQLLPLSCTRYHDISRFMNPVTSGIPSPHILYHIRFHSSRKLEMIPSIKHSGWERIIIDDTIHQNNSLHLQKRRNCFRAASTFRGYCNSGGISNGLLWKSKRINQVYGISMYAPLRG